MFDAMILNSRINFFQRVLVLPEGAPTLKALDYDERVLQSHRVGLSHDLLSFLSDFFDTTHIEDLSWRDISWLQDLRDGIMVQRSEEFRVSFRRSSGLSFWADISETATMPLQFGEYLGTLDYEVARIVLLVLGDVFRFSLSATRSQCPFCPIELHTTHLFLCPNAPFMTTLPRWGTVLDAIRLAEWALVVTTLFLCLRQWTRNSNFFQPKVRDRVDLFFGEE
jgi:hypothetical protein